MWVKSKQVFFGSSAGVFISFSHAYTLGFAFHDWGIRIMLIWWHFCWHIRLTNRFLKRDGRKRVLVIGDDKPDFIKNLNKAVREKSPTP